MMEKSKFHIGYSELDPYGQRFIDLPRFQRAVYNRNAIVALALKNCRGW